MKVRQRQFWFNDAHDKPLPLSPIYVDGFAGGGGASEGFRRAIGVSPHVAINHDKDAIHMHMANHPETKHYCENIWNVDPEDASEGRPIAAAWFSPDCTHFTKARGEKPVKKNIRGLAWVVIKWAELPKEQRPKVIFIENVEEFLTWGPVNRETNKPIKEKAGVTFDLWVWKLRELGYHVEWKILTASDYGAPTTRKRLFIVARCDGKSIVWPEPTHGGPKQIEKDIKLHGVSKRKPWRTAAEIIDWSIPCPSIFLTPEEAKAQGCIRPLASKTMHRIAEGIRRYVIETNDPFIVCCNHGGEHFRGQSLGHPLSTVTSKNGYGLVSPMLTPFTSAGHQGGSSRGIDQPHRTICASFKDTHSLIAPTLVSYYGPKGDNHHRGRSVDEPIPTQTTENRFGVVAPHLSRMFGQSIGSSADSPVGTATQENKTALVSAFIAKHFGGVIGIEADRPFPTITTVGTQNQLVTANLVKNNHGVVQCRVEQVRAFLMSYYGNGDNCREAHRPAPTVTTKDRLCLGIVLISGEPWQIIDVGMRMLTPRELFNAQGFRSDYIIDTTHDGRPVTKKAQVARCGNSVCPDVAEALVRANLEVKNGSV